MKMAVVRIMEKVNPIAAPAECQHPEDGPAAELLTVCPDCGARCSETQVGDDGLCYDQRCPLHVMAGPAFAAEPRISCTGPAVAACRDTTRCHKHTAYLTSGLALDPIVGESPAPIDGPKRYRPSAEWRGPVVAIDHSGIPSADLEIALRNAALSPDGEVYPWRDLYPLVGQTVYAVDGEGTGKLWIVASKERPAGAADSPIAVVSLVGCGHDASLVAARYELRPVSWSQHDEMWRGRE